MYLALKGIGLSVVKIFPPGNLVLFHTDQPEVKPVGPWFFILLAKSTADTAITATSTAPYATSTGSPT